VTQFWIVGAVLILAGLLLGIFPIWRNRATGDSPVIAVVLAVLFPALVVGLYFTLSTYKWDAEELAATTPVQVEDMVAALEERLASGEGSVDEWLMLGRSKVTMQDFPAALNAYQQAWDLSGNTSPEAALGVAEAQVYIDKSALAGEAGNLVEWVLSVQPDNPRALWFGGLVSLAKGQQTEAATRWTKLLNYDMPDQLRQVIQQQLAALPTVEGATPAGGVKVEVALSLSESLQEQDLNANTLYVFVRAGQGGPPLAVKRLPASALPTAITLTDADVMMPGASLSGKENLSVTARLSMSGEPIAQAGDLEGSAVWNGEPVQLVIDTTL